MFSLQQTEQRLMDKDDNLIFLTVYFFYIYIINKIYKIQI